MNFLREIADFILPRTCSACSRKLSITENYICPDCFLSLEIASPEIVNQEYIKNFSIKGYISALISLYLFQKEKPIQDIIHSIKYRRKFDTGKYLGKAAGYQFQNSVMDWDLDYIIPVPLHRVKNAERGYNQSYYIAKGMSSALHLPIKTDLLKRIKYTESQAMMSVVQKEKNISKAFKCKGKIEPLNYLLVDDVITTGATVSECGRVLLENGAAKVFAASLAITN